MVDQGDLVFCGTPEEYEMSKLDPNSKLILDKHIF
jgi:hypothetical protein